MAKKNNSSSSCGFFSWILPYSMASWDSYLLLSSTLGLQQVYYKIFLAMPLPLLNNFFIIFLVMSSYFGTHHKHGGLMHVNPLDA